VCVHFVIERAREIAAIAARNGTDVAFANREHKERWPRLLSALWNGDGAPKPTVDSFVVPDFR
jgi:hypothetical protein